jgi:flagellar biosynthesis chaperone FliJ
MFILTEQLILEAQINKALVLCESEVLRLDPNVNKDFLTNLMEDLHESPDLLFEFLGTIAGLGSRAFGKVASRFGGMSDKLNAYRQNIARNKQLKIHGKSDFSKSLHNYAAALRSNNPDAMRDAASNVDKARQLYRKNRTGHSTIASLNSRNNRVYRDAQNSFISRLEPSKEDKEESFGSQLAAHIRSLGGNATNTAPSPTAPKPSFPVTPVKPNRNMKALPLLAKYGKNRGAYATKLAALRRNAEFKNKVAGISKSSIHGKNLPSDKFGKSLGKSGPISKPLEVVQRKLMSGTPVGFNSTKAALQQKKLKPKINPRDPSFREPLR